MVGHISRNIWSLGGGVASFAGETTLRRHIDQSRSVWLWHSHITLEHHRGPACKKRLSLLSTLDDALRIDRNDVREVIEEDIVIGMTHEQLPGGRYYGFYLQVEISTDAPPDQELRRTIYLAAKTTPKAVWR